MSHRSRLCSLVIDCHVDDLGPATEFWSRTLGKKIASVDQDGDGKYAELETAPDEPMILLQKVDHASRVHLDIETDDLEAEAERLEALGAKRIAFVHERWWVMEAPTGHRFCIVRRQREKFGPHLNEWPD
ncbi:VOC family protein [Dokdonella sp.]|uniref:VOC family protein n=1 Tax=Dokdonella sp. TaxID=2291710 RepID=UPI001B2BE192|nr:VOC family protein [Dokdonella sp.]MBO9664602.1 VOC family protein [Dokdonella sp.]